MSDRSSAPKKGKTYRDCRADICARNDAPNEHRRPYADIRRLEPVQRHILLLHRERVVSRKRVEQARACRECRHGSHELRKRDDREAHECQLRADRVIVQLRDRDRIRSSRDGRDTLHREEQREHVREPDDPRARDTAHNRDGCEELRALRFFSDLGGRLAAFECIHGLQEAQEDDEAAALPTGEAVRGLVSVSLSR